MYVPLYHPPEAHYSQHSERWQYLHTWPYIGMFLSHHLNPIADE